MALRPEVRARLEAKKSTSVHVLRGEEILAGEFTDFESFIGQDLAVESLELMVSAALKRSEASGTKETLPHFLLASGQPGIGKTSLVRLVAFCYGVGLVMVSGKIREEEALATLRSMEDGDILAIEEAHSTGSPPWLLTLMSEGIVATSTGPVTVPRVTVAATTTELGMMGEALLTRFAVRPKLVPYSTEEQEMICELLETRLDVKGFVVAGDHPRIARAANGTPRVMTGLLTTLRDLAAADRYSIKRCFELYGVSDDGLDSVAQDMLLALLATKNYTASRATLGHLVGEPGSLKHSERLLLAAGYMEIQSRGFKLTESGVEKAQELI